MTMILYEIDPVTNCWNHKPRKYTRNCSHNNPRQGGRIRQARRMLYEQQNGRIPDGMNLKRVCHNPSCINPDHIAFVPDAKTARFGITGKNCIPLTQGKATVVDDVDFEYLNQFTWRAQKSNQTFYALRSINGHDAVSMHREIA